LKKLSCKNRNILILRKLRFIKNNRIVKKENGGLNMSIIGDVIFYGIIWLFGWYLFLIGGIILIIVGFYFDFYILIIFGVILIINGISGLVLRRKLEKKEGDKIAGFITILSFGLIFILFDLYFFSYSLDIYLYTIVGLVMILIGGIGLFFTIRKHQRVKTQEKNARNVEDIIYNYLKENKGKAFTSKSIFSRCEEIKEFDVIISNIKRILANLTVAGKINSSEKEGELFYYAK